MLQTRSLINQYVDKETSDHLFARCRKLFRTLIHTILQTFPCTSGDYSIQRQRTTTFFFFQVKIQTRSIIIPHNISGIIQIILLTRQGINLCNVRDVFEFLLSFLQSQRRTQTLLIAASEMRFYTRMLKIHQTDKMSNRDVLK